MFINASNNTIRIHIEIFTPKTPCCRIEAFEINTTGVYPLLSGKMAEDGTVTETDKGITDLSVDTQLANAKKLLQSE